MFYLIAIFWDVKLGITHNSRVITKERVHIRANQESRCHMRIELGV